MVSSGARSSSCATWFSPDPILIGTTQRSGLKTDDDIDMFVKGHIDRKVPEADRASTTSRSPGSTPFRRGLIETHFNTDLLHRRRQPRAGAGGHLGRRRRLLLTLLVTLLLSFPIGVMAAIYLEEFAPKNRWTDLIEVNINNLAAVPSIVFGLLGLAVFLNFFGLPRSAPLVGGMVLALMTLPTIIIASRAALKAVPPSIREAALGMGASKMQTVFHHVLPLAMPGILTGTIIGMAQALGETAPLLMIGMVAFIVDIPGGFTDPATVLPVQIFLWADSPERAFVERTSAAIMVLLGFLILMNALAVMLRKRFERAGSGRGLKNHDARLTEDRPHSHGSRDAAPATDHPEVTGQVREPRVNVNVSTATSRRCSMSTRHRRERGDRADRPVGLRQVDLPALPQPDERHHRHLPGDRRDHCWTATTSTIRRRSTWCSCARGSAWCSRSPTRSRSRSTTMSPTARASTAWREQGRAG